jgi:hypothetical protein
MYRRLLPFVAIGLVIVAAVLSLTLYLTRGTHLELRGSIQKLRTLAVEDAGSIAVVDFRFINPSDYPFIVKKLTVTFATADGRTLEGDNISEVDARRVFEYYPVLGQKFNETLRLKEKVGARQAMDKMIAVRFNVAESEIQSPRQIRIRIDDVDGAVSEIVK